MLHVESAIGQIPSARSDLGLPHTMLQEQFGELVIQHCEPDLLANAADPDWSADEPPPFIRAIVLDPDPPVPVASTSGRLAARMTPGSSGVYMHYVIPCGNESQFLAERVAAVTDALVCIHRRLWQASHPKKISPLSTWLAEAGLIASPLIVELALQGQQICAMCGTIGQLEDSFCGGCGAAWM